MRTAFTVVAIQGGAGLLLLGFALYVFLSQRRNLSLGAFMIMGGSAAFWVLTDTVRVIAAYQGGPVHLISPVGGMLVVLTGWSVLNFALRFEYEGEPGRRVIVSRIMLALSVVAALFAWHDQWAYNRRMEHGIPVSDIGWPFLITSGSAFLMISAAIGILLVRFRRESLPVRRTRLLYCTIGISLFTFSAYMFSLLLPLLELRHLFFIGPSSSALFVLVMFWAVFTRQLFNVRGAVFKIGLFFYQTALIVVTLALGFAAYLAYSLEVRVFEAVLVATTSFAVARSIYVLTKPYLIRRFANAPNENLIPEITSLTVNLSLATHKKFCNAIANALVRSFNLEGIAFFRFERGGIDLHTVGRIPSLANLIRRHQTVFLRVGPALFAPERPTVFWVEQADETFTYLESHGHRRLIGRVERFRVDLLESRIDIFFPVMYDKEMMVTFLLGRKNTGEPFYPAELRRLASLAGVIGVALKNNQIVNDIRAMQEALRAENTELRKSASELAQGIVNLAGGKKLLYGDGPMAAVVDEVQRAAPTDEIILILGESGTGKELVASMVHELSARREGPFLSINCGAIVESLLQSELFGHEKGSFTGADRLHRGLFEQAHGGTLFLDEIGEMTPSVQVQMLRVLQNQTITRIGGPDVRVDVRIIAATNRNLEEMVEKGSFRLDLFYRLNVIPIRMPSLRERPRDIPLLVQHYLEKFGERLNRPNLEISKDALRVLSEYDWPGNVRELENILLRAAVNARGPVLGRSDFPSLSFLSDRQPGLQVTRPRGSSKPPSVGSMVRENEKSLILRAMQIADGNKAKAARILGMSRSTFYLKLEKYSLE